MNYTELSFPIGAGEQRERLIAALSEAGCDAFEETDESLRAFYAKGKLDLSAVDQITSDFGLSYIAQNIPEQNWNAAWERSFEPVTVPGFCTIRADFHEADNSVEHEIIITPKMSFGTGHHATTRLMVQAMRGMDFEGKSVLDFGTGTGILAILAERLKAADIWAIDNDTWSVENAMENVAANHTAGVRILPGSLEVVAGKAFDIILANINRHILLRYMAEMRSLFPSGGMLVVSGILTEDEGIIAEAAVKSGFTQRSLTLEGNWICIIFTV